MQLTLIPFRIARGDTEGTASHKVPDGKLVEGMPTDSA